MRTIGEFNSFNLGTIKDEESGQVALYHYLKNFYHEESPLSSEIVNHFFADSLQLPHWQEHRTELYRSVMGSLKKFFGTAGNESLAAGSQFIFNEVMDVEKAQLVTVTNTEDLFAIVQKHETTHLGESESLRILMDSEHGAIAIKRFRTGELIVRTYTPLVRVQGHLLTPLRPAQEINYDSNLELRLGASHTLKTAPHSRVSFQIKRDSISAQFISGFAFRLNQEVTLSSLTEEPRIFYPLKRLERFFISRATDPYYVELIAGLEKAMAHARNHDGAIPEFARKVFEAAQIAFDQIYPDDKALFGRLRELARFNASARSFAQLR